MKAFKFVLIALLWLGWTVIFVVTATTVNPDLDFVTGAFDLLGRITLVMGYTLIAGFVTVNIQDIGKSKSIDI